MPARSSALPLALAPLDRESPVPLQAQLYNRVRDAILAGQLLAGTRLPSSRLLAAELAVSRNTATGAFDRLLAEGYVEARVGDGAYVARALPEELLHAQRAAAGPDGATGPPRLSRRGELLGAAPSMPRYPGAGPAFWPGVAALDEFPRRVWRRLIERHARRPDSALLRYGVPAGYPPLRAAIAGYLGAARGVRCAPEQIIVVAGSQPALNLAARLLLDVGDAAAIEDPGYSWARDALLAAGARLVPVPVDAAGLDLGAAGPLDGVRLVYVTPSYQYPLGVTLSLPRRLALLAWARGAGAWVLEDDYDGEYRYAGRPLPALQGLDADGRVIYLGTFSKVMFPGLRLGYLVAPPSLVDAFVAARLRADLGAPLLEQAALADFIAEGHLGRHVRRMRTLYAERQAALVAAARRDLDGLLEMSPSDAGMHLVGWLSPGADDRAVARRAASHRVAALPLSAYALAARPRPGLVLGYAWTDEAEIVRGVRGLRAALLTPA